MRHHSAFAGAPEPVGAAGARREFIDHVEANLHDRDHDELGQSFHRCDDKRRTATIPGGNEDLPLIIRVDQPDQVSQHDAVLVPEPRSREHQRREARIGEMDRNAAWNEFRLPGASVSGVSMQARKSSPAEPGVA